MNTNTIKSFAKAARLKLLEGVESKLKYWGINEDGEVLEEPEATYGGYIFRGQVYTNTTAIDKWKRLKTKIKDKQAVKDVIEEAAYTWFNRLMAIKILEKNGYIPLTIGCENYDNTPAILQEAKKGNYKPIRNSDQKNLLELLNENDEEKAFGLLVTDFCNKHPLLKEVFGRINDYTELLIPNNLLTNGGIIEMINSTKAIIDEDYKQVELIGWLYQFYISDRKDEVFTGFKKNIKARPEDIPAATQIFTPKWIVKYMVENTVGKIWLDYNPESTIRKEMKYLVDNEPATSNQQPATNSIIADITELTLMDPACGSGHILVEGFELLMKMYLEEGYTKKNAAISILENNLYGLEIDDRAAQLARFALLLKAASYYPEIINLSALEAKNDGCNIHSFPDSATFTSDELLTVIGHEGIPLLKEIKEALDLLQQGKNIGSALKLNISEDALKFIEELFHKDHSSFVWQGLKPFLEIIITLSRKYYTVAANPPYMGLNNYNKTLLQYLEEIYCDSRHEISNVFLETCIYYTVENGLVGLINPQSWMFLKSYISLRKKILTNFSILSLIHLGPHSFPEIKGEVVQTSTYILLKAPPQNNRPIFFRLVNFENSQEKENAFVKKLNSYKSLLQKDFIEIEEHKLQYGVFRNLLTEIKKGNFIKNYFDTREGLTTGDNDRFIRFHYEVNKKKIGIKWFKHIKGGDYRKWYGNLLNIVNWENDGFEIKNNKTTEGRIRSHNYNEDFIFRKGFTWSSFGKETTFRYVSEGHIFDSSGCMGFSFDESNELLLSAISFLNSKIVENLLPYIKGNNNAKPGHIGLIPIRYTQNNTSVKSSELCQKNIQISKTDWDSHETSWDFDKSPFLYENLSLKQTYQNWQKNVTQDFFMLHSNEEELNCIFIDIYSLQEELTPEVPLKDITILQDEIDREELKKREEEILKVARAKRSGTDNEEFIPSPDFLSLLPVKKDVVISQFLSYCIGIIMGRYRLDKPGLNIAHPNPTEEELNNYNYKKCKVDIDDDAIIPFIGSESAFPDDVVNRVKSILIAIWEEETLTENLNFISECLGMDMERWLTEKFWSFHIRMYKKRPIYWMFTSNTKYPQSAAFKVLVYMHRLDKYTVQKIRNNYLHPHQSWLKREIEILREDEASLSHADQKRFTKLQQFEIECSDYDEILKDLANRQIEIDLDDGVKVNIEKFKPAVADVK